MLCSYVPLITFLVYTFLHESVGDDIDCERANTRNRHSSELMIDVKLVKSDEMNQCFRRGAMNNNEADELNTTIVLQRFHINQFNRDEYDGVNYG
ncbi:unnamed protein product [Schistosoma turkestanicum]|nr:unnamed protein product [Schistosoma turkestanicum]